MSVELYYYAASPGARAVLLTLQALAIPYKIKHIDLQKGEQRTDEFLKLNPQHTVPVIIDTDGFILSESHAINSYLVGKYGKNDQLYPKDLKARAVVDHKLYFDAGVLFSAVKKLAGAFFYDKTITGLSPNLVDTFEQAYDILETYLSPEGSYIAGNQITIADFSVLTTLSYMSFLVPIEKEKFPMITAYIERGNANIPNLEELHNIAIASMKIRYKDFNN